MIASALRLMMWSGSVSPLVAVSRFRVTLRAATLAVVALTPLKMLGDFGKPVYFADSIFYSKIESAISARPVIM